jgi:hypothetical protein
MVNAGNYMLAEQKRGHAGPHKSRGTAMSINLTNPIFHDNEAARLFLAGQRWPDGPVPPLRQA